MSNHARRHDESRLRRAVEAVRRAYAEFLTIPSLVILVFLGTGAGVYFLDKLRIERGWMSLVPGTHESVSTLLGTIAGSIITVTSITFSLLLVAVQQGAAALTGQVYDQFLRRRDNQFYFGFFIGLALYCLIVLATVRPQYTPVYGATLAFALTAVALFMLVLLIYSTIDQMRPVMILRTIRDHALAAREFERRLLGATQESLSLPPATTVTVEVQQSGFLTSIDPEVLRCVARDRLGASAVVVVRSIGDYVSIGDPVAELRFDGAAAEGCEALLEAFVQEEQRDLASDPAFGVDQLAIIAWTSASTSKSNPQPALLACWALRDLIAHWHGVASEPVQRSSDPFPIVYRDRLPHELLRTLESLSVVASESMQHQTLAEVYRALSAALRYFPAELRQETANTVLRSLSALGDQVLTTRLDEALEELRTRLVEAGDQSAAEAVEEARRQLARSIGVLHSRSDRVPTA